MGWVVSVLMLLGSARVSAQACHMGPDPLLQAEQPTPEKPTRFHAGLGLIAAGYDNHFGSGNYQGLNALFAYQTPWLTLGASLAGYRIARDGTEHFGIGDAALDARGTLYRNEARGLSLGLGLAAMLPTGKAEHGLGMGHAMLMPGVWAMWVRERFSLHVDVSYGRAIGGDSHEAHGNAHAEHSAEEHAHSMMHTAAPHGSIVQPMNSSELTHAVTAGLSVLPPLRLVARLFGAVPVAAQGGKTREVVAAGAQLSLGRWDMGAEVQVPIVGSPFLARGLLTSGVSW